MVNSPKVTITSSRIVNIPYKKPLHIEYESLNLKLIKNKNVVLITSKIYVSNNSFSYCKNRSIYTSKERFDQTLKTIQSIKENIPDFYIILFDNSIFNESEKLILNESVDHFINIKDDNNLNYYTDEYQYKAFSEMAQQISFYDIFLKNSNINNIKNFFKISGRYLINENFNYSKYDNYDNIMKKNLLVSDREYFYTCFYKLNNKILHYYFESLKQIFNNKEPFLHMDFEVIIPKILEGKFNTVETLGITQMISVSDDMDRKNI